MKKSGRRLPHSKTLRESLGRWNVREVLDCAKGQSASDPLAVWKTAQHYGWLFSRFSFASAAAISSHDGTCQTSSIP